MTARSFGADDVNEVFNAIRSARFLFLSGIGPFSFALSFSFPPFPLRPFCTLAEYAYVYSLGRGLGRRFSFRASSARGGGQFELQPEGIALCPEMAGGMPP